MSKNIARSEMPKRRRIAEIALEMILRGDTSYQKELVDLYAEYQLDSIYHVIEDAFKKMNINGEKIIESKPLRKINLYKIKQQVDNETAINQMLLSVNNWEMPEDKYLKEIFGSYVPFVKSSTQDFHNLRIMRICDIPYTNHTYRCAGMAYLMHLLDNADKLGSAEKEGAKWHAHDNPEELLIRLGYSFDQLQKYFDDKIPKDLHEELRDLSNIPKMIHIYWENKSFKNVDKFLSALRKLGQKKNFQIIRSTTENMITEIENNKEKYVGKPNFRDLIYNDIYANLYLKPLSDNPRLYEDKGRFDYLDNVVGRHSRDLLGRRSTISKGLSYYNIGKALNNKDIDPTLNDILLILNNAAKEIIVEYLAQPVACLSHVQSGMNTMVDLKGTLVYESNSISPS